LPITKLKILPGMDCTAKAKRLQAIRLGFTIGILLVTI